MNTGLRPLGREKLWLALLLAPTIIGLILGSVGSVIASIGISMTRWDLINKPTWAWLDNFVEIFKNESFGLALRNTIQFTILYVPAVIIISLLVALLLNRKIRGRAVFRTMYFLPSITSAVAVSLMFSWLYAKDTGLINNAITSLGGKAVTWLGTQDVSPLNWMIQAFHGTPSPALSIQMIMVSVVIANVWGAIGEGMVIFLAGLQSVPREYYEAATVDGANGWNKFWNVTLPLITPSIFFQLLITTINAFQAFEYIYMLTRRGNGDSSIPVVVFSIYRNGFRWFNMGGASAQALILAVIITLLMLFYFWLEKKYVVYE